VAEVEEVGIVVPVLSVMQVDREEEEVEKMVMRVVRQFRLVVDTHREVVKDTLGMELEVEVEVEEQMNRDKIIQILQEMEEMDLSFPLFLATFMEIMAGLLEVVQEEIKMAGKRVA